MGTAPLTVAQTRVESCELILPSDLNATGCLFGGRLVTIIDKIAGISAFRHVRHPVATLSIDHLVFRKPVRAGSVVTVKASVNRVFNRSMEVGVIAMVQSSAVAEEECVCSAYLTFVAPDASGKSMELPPILSETGEDKRRFEQAGIRREHRLALQAQLGKTGKALP